MEKIVKTLMNVIKHFSKNFSDYCSLGGISCILYYVWVTYGFNTLMLSIGVVLIFMSFNIEVNKLKK